MNFAARTSIFIVLVAAGFVFADDFSIDWYTVDGGGAMRSTGGTFDLSSTIGQPDAQVAPVMSGGTFELTGGFWAMTSACHCPGDLNNDGKRNGADVQQFVNCLLASGGNCSCADLDAADGVTTADISVFIGDLLGSPTCP